VFGDKVRITLSDSSGFEIPRFRLGNSRTLPMPFPLTSSELKFESNGSIGLVREEHAHIVYLLRTSQPKWVAFGRRPTPVEIHEILYDNGKLVVELAP
jgi:hypothetical protein